MKQLLILLLLFLSLMFNGIDEALFSLIGGNESYDQIGTLQEFIYSPGYSDMSGGGHSETLQKNEAGDWVIISYDREMYSDPLTITTYAVSGDAVEQFEAFLKEHKVPALFDRKDSDLFATDYSPWSLSMEFVDDSGQWRSYTLSEYKEYSDQDDELIREVKAQFAGLHGENLSQVEEED